MNAHGAQRKYVCTYFTECAAMCAPFAVCLCHHVCRLLHIYLECNCLLSNFFVCLFGWLFLLLLLLFLCFVLFCFSLYCASFESCYFGVLLLSLYLVPSLFDAFFDISMLTTVFSFATLDYLVLLITDPTTYSCSCTNA